MDSLREEEEEGGEGGGGGVEGSKVKHRFPAAESHFLTSFLAERVSERGSSRRAQMGHTLSIFFYSQFHLLVRILTASASTTYCHLIFFFPFVSQPINIARMRLKQ